MSRPRIGQLVSYDGYSGRLNGQSMTGKGGVGVVRGVRDNGAVLYVEFDNNPNIQRGCSANLCTPLTREQRAVRIAKQAMGLKP